ncbi:MAG TPA: hypothetical protein VLQ93_24110, partial [Myxococcaceae bacterium]|nr:hypothetical protein [Myxococcaceae bacterium]
MQSVDALPGLERLVEVCRGKGHPMKQEPPLTPAPVAGRPVAGLPLDPLLAAVHARVGYLWVRDGFFLLPARDGWRPDLAGVNERWRRNWPEPFRSLVVFAQDDRMAYVYATVPSLATASGSQPVVWVDTYEDLYALPVASDVDRFLEAYSRYLELPEQPGEYEEGGLPARLFPWDVPEIIARDGALMTMLSAGHFDFLSGRSERARRW